MLNVYNIINYQNNLIHESLKPPIRTFIGFSPDNCFNVDVISKLELIENVIKVAFWNRGRDYVERF